MNNIQVIQAYPRQIGDQILKAQIACDEIFEVVVEAKAGTAVHSSGARFNIHITVRDLTDFTIVCKDYIHGWLASKPWEEPALAYAFQIPAPGTCKAFHVCEVLATLSVGVRNPSTFFVCSPRFIITPRQHTVGNGEGRFEMVRSGDYALVGKYNN